MFDLNGVKYLNTRETAELLGMSAGTLRNQRLNGRETVQSIRIGGSVLYRLSDVERAGHMR